MRYLVLLLLACGGPPVGGLPPVDGGTACTSTFERCSDDGRTLLTCVDRLVVETSCSVPCRLADAEHDRACQVP